MKWAQVASHTHAGRTYWRRGNLSQWTRPYAADLVDLCAVDLFLPRELIIAILKTSAARDAAIFCSCSRSAYTTGAVADVWTDRIDAPSYVCLRLFGAEPSLRLSEVTVDAAGRALRQAQLVEQGTDPLLAALMSEGFVADTYRRPPGASYAEAARDLIPPHIVAYLELPPRETSMVASLRGASDDAIRFAVRWRRSDAIVIPSIVRRRIKTRAQIDGFLAMTPAQRRAYVARSSIMT